MRFRDKRVWALIFAAAFLVLWCLSVGVALSSHSADAAVGSGEVGPSLGERVVGISGWCLVGAGVLTVALTAAFSGKPKRRRSAPYSPVRTIRLGYSPTSPRRGREGIRR